MPLDELELLDEELLDDDELLLDDEDDELEEELLDELLELAALPPSARPPHPAVTSTQTSAVIDNAIDRNLFNGAIVMDLRYVLLGTAMDTSEYQLWGGIPQAA